MWDTFFYAANFLTTSPWLNQAKLGQLWGFFLEIVTKNQSRSRYRSFEDKIFGKLNGTIGDFVAVIVFKTLIKNLQGVAENHDFFFVLYSRCLPNKTIKKSNFLQM
jgi:hypothetical protein